MALFSDPQAATTQVVAAGWKRYWEAVAAGTETSLDLAMGEPVPFGHRVYDYVPHFVVTPPPPGRCAHCAAVTPEGTPLVHIALDGHLEGHFWVGQHCAACQDTCQAGCLIPA